MLTIASKFHPYTVEVATDLGAILTERVPAARTFLLVDENILRLYAAPFEDWDPERLISVEATEKQKSFEAMTPLFLRLLETGFRKDCTLLVIGGGVVQDIGCFIASVLFRGVRWELVPTTLLAQCDSCIGSKSSLNIGPFKNQLGTFYPPHAVHMVFDLLRTLPADEIRSGIGEIIKLSLIAGESAMAKLRPLLARLDDPATLPALILEALQIKQRYIEQDELDAGIRNLLNYGHTFGHAYESATRYAIPHGIAVTLGMATATYVSERLGLLPAGAYQELDAFLRPFYNPHHLTLAQADRDAIFVALAKDKKNTGNAINAILTEGPGRMKKFPLSKDEQVKPLIADFLSGLDA